MFGLQFESARHVQGVKRAAPETGRVAPGKFCANFKRHLRKADFTPHSICPVLLKLSCYLLRFLERQTSLENMLLDGVCPFGAMQRRKPRTRS